MKDKLFLYDHFRSKPEMTHQPRNLIIFRASTHHDDSNELSCVKIGFDENVNRDRKLKKSRLGQNLEKITGHHSNIWEKWRKSRY